MIIHSPIISGSLTFANGATITLPAGSVYSGSFSGSYQGSTFTGGTFSGTINSTNGVVSGSSQVSYVGLSNIPAGIVSSSAQIDSLFNLDGVVSGSSQLTASYDSRYLTIGGDSVVSGSSQITFSGISSLPTLVSGSSQIDHNSTTNYVANRHIDHTAVSITAGTGLSGGGDISATRTLAIDQTITATVTGSQTLTNKTISGASNTLSNIANASLTNSSITIAGTSTSLGGSITAATILQGTGVVSGSSQVVGSAITTNTITIGSTSTALGGTSTSLAGLTSVTSTGFTGALTGNASTATTLQTARTINGTSFDGSANITIANLVSGSAQISGTGITNNTITIAGTSTALGGSITAPTILQGTGVVSGSSQVTLASTTGFGTYLNQAVLTSSSPTFASLILSGDLTVNGTTTTVNSNTVNIGDNVIILNSDETGVPSQNAGIEIERGTSTNATLVWDEANDYWEAGLSGSEVPLATTTGTQTLTNKTIAAGSNTISGLTNSNLSGTAGITNANLANSAITIAGTSTSLGGTITAEQIRTAIGTVVTGSAQIDHNSTTNYVANRHIDHTAVSISAGNGISGGGDISATRTITLDTGSAHFIGGARGTNSAGTGISYSGGVITNTGVTSNVAGSGISVSGATGAVTITNTGVTSNVAGTGVSVSGATGAVTISIGQAVATSSNVQFNSLGIGMAASATAGRIDATNDIVAYSSSDIRFKENITPIENAIDKINQIGGYTYDWKEENKIEHGYDGNDVGVIAQEIEAVLPQLVQTRESGYKAVKYDKLVALLIEGIKEQQFQIDELRNKIEKLENGK